MTTTSYAILGLLAVKPWTTHELVQQVDRSLRRFWPVPRASSTRSRRSWSPMASPAPTTTRSAGADAPATRSRPKGRRALATWLKEPGAGPVLEFEQLLKIGFADSGSKADILTGLEATMAWVVSQNEENLATARAYLEGEGAFPQRAALNQLDGRFLTDFYVTVAEWVEWATDVVEDWPDDVSLAAFDVIAAEDAVRLAERIHARATTRISFVNEVSVIAYFAGDPSRTYQLVQWLDVLEILNDVHPVCIVLRDPESAAVIESRTDLPLFTAATFPELTDLYAELEREGGALLQQLGAQLRVPPRQSAAARPHQPR